MRAERRPGHRRRTGFLAGAVPGPVVARRCAVDGCHDLDPYRPAALRRDLRSEENALRRQLGVGSVRADPRLADVPAPLVPEHERVAVDARERLARTVDRRVLVLKQVGEVCAHRDRDLGTDWFRSVVEDVELLEEAVADDAVTDHGQRRVRVLGSRPGDEEEASRERLRVVGRERVERLSVHRQQPPREMARVAMEQPVRLAGSGIDVAVTATDDERVSLEDADLVVLHHAMRYAKSAAPRMNRTATTVTTQTWPSRSHGVSSLSPASTVFASSTRLSTTSFSMPPSSSSPPGLASVDTAIDCGICAHGPSFGRCAQERARRRSTQLDEEATMEEAPILICYDGSTDSDRAIETAAALFGGRRAVVADIGPMLTGAERARRAGFDAEARAELSSATWEGIVDVADEIDAAVIVLGSRGLSGIRERLNGSVSHEVAEHSRRPVLIVPPTNER